MVVRENPSRSAVFEILRPARLATTTIPHLKSLKSPFFPILMLGLNFDSSAVFEIFRPARLATTTIPHSKSLKSTFFPILMLGLNFSKLSSPSLAICYQAIEQVYLIKWPVSVYIYSIYIYYGWHSTQMSRFGTYLGSGVTVQYDFGTTGKKYNLCSGSFHLFWTDSSANYNFSCTEPRGPYRDGLVQIHVPCHP